MNEFNTDRHKIDTETGEIWSRIIGGGKNGRQWLAEITGPDPKFGLSRRFLNKQELRSGTGRSGRDIWVIQNDGIFEFRDFADGSNRTHSGFIRVEGEDVTMMSKAEVVAHFNGK